MSPTYPAPSCSASSANWWRAPRLCNSTWYRIVAFWSSRSCCNGRRATTWRWRCSARSSAWPSIWWRVCRPTAICCWNRWVAFGLLCGMPFSRLRTHTHRVSRRVGAHLFDILNRTIVYVIESALAKMWPLKIALKLKWLHMYTLACCFYSWLCYFLLGFAQRTNFNWRVLKMLSVFFSFKLKCPCNQLSCFTQKVISIWLNNSVLWGGLCGMAQARRKWPEKGLLMYFVGPGGIIVSVIRRSLMQTVDSS